MKKQIIMYYLVLHVLRFNSAGNNTRPAFLLGLSDFSKIVETTSFVDKTLFIKEVFKYDFILITAPHKFAKSTNLDMLKTFLEIVVDEHGHPVNNVEKDKEGNLVEKPQNKLTDNFKLFKKHNLNVYQDKKFFYAHCGQIPVMHVDLKGVGGNSAEEVLDSLKSVVYETFQKHSYLLNCTELWLSDKEQAAGKFRKKTFLKYWDSAEHKNLTVTDIELGLPFLSVVLHKHFDKQVFVLIDDFDVPIIDAIFDSELEVGEYVNFIKKFISLFLENNPHVNRALINACSQLAKVYLTSNFAHFPFLHNHIYVEFYGFTENEVGSILNKFKLRVTLTQLERWYGYKTVGKSVTIYRIWPIIHYLQFNALKNYLGFVNNLKHTFLNKEIKVIIEKLLKDENVVAELIPETDVKQIQSLRRLADSSLPPDENSNGESVNLLLQFFCDSGYLNTKKVLGVKMETTYLKLQIPNEEVREELTRNLQMCNLIHLLHS